MPPRKSAASTKQNGSNGGLIPHIVIQLLRGICKSHSHPSLADRQKKTVLSATISRETVLRDDCRKTVISPLQKMASPNYIYFGLYGEFDPEKVAQEIDLSPTESIAKHARCPERRIPRCAIMRYAQTHADEKEQVLDVHTLAEKVVEQLEPYTQQFAAAIKKYDATATLEVVFEFPISEEVSTPILGFSKRVIAFAAATGATIDLDSYRTTS